MSSTIFLSAASFCYILIIVIIYFSKERVNTSETRVFARLLIVSCASLISELYITMIPTNIDIPLFVISLKLYLILCVLWLSYFMEYVFIITRNDKDRSLINYKAKYKKIYRIFWGIVVFVLLAVIYLPINFFNENGMKYSYGQSVNVVFGLSALYTLIMSFYVIKNLKKLKDSGYLPIIFFIILMAITGVIQKINPALLLANTCFALITSLMYHTIENPDIKMVDELIRNRKIIERTAEEKSLFLFKISQEMRIPIKYINEEIATYEKSKLSKKEIDVLMRNISSNNKKMNYIINDVLGITNYDSSNIKIFNTVYNIYSLLNEVEKRVRTSLKSDIDLKFNYSSNMPKELYGDSIKLKQVLMSILINSIKNTKKGYIHLDISSVTKYDICRLVISIKDSGSGIDLMTVNRILDQDSELTDSDYKKINSLDVNLTLVSKIIKMLNGTMYIQSEINKGTEVLITLDQYIKEESNKDSITIIDNYIKSRENKQKVLVVDDEEKELKLIKNKLEKKGYDVYTSLHGNDCIARIKNEETYDLILIDDEMNVMNGITLINELNVLKNKSKKIILLEEGKLFIGHHYIEEGFDDYIDKSNIFEELNKKC